MKTKVTLEEMNNLAIEVECILEKLNDIIILNETGEDNELVKLNTLPDSEYKNFRFISDLLAEYARVFDGVRDYGME